MIQAVMLISLGFLAASLLALLVAPAAWARAVRLTSHRIRSSLPINETEIRAEKDQLRASHAVTVHQLEKKIERAEMRAARQRVELNRRDAKITELEEDAVRVSAMLDENRNARHVLAQTLNERLPRAEERLQETRLLLKARDSQVVKFVNAATQQHVALTHANEIIAQRDQDMKRLNAALMARQYAVRQRGSSETLAQTAALQAEISELRERSANQSRLIDRIQEAGKAKFESDLPTETDGALIGATTGDAGNDTRDEDGPKGFAQKFIGFRAALVREKETTARLRAELASAHDRAAKISSHYRGELRNLSRSSGPPARIPDTLAQEAPLPERHGGEDDRGKKLTLLERAGESSSDTAKKRPNGKNGSNGKNGDRKVRKGRKGKSSLSGSASDESSSETASRTFRSERLADRLRSNEDRQKEEKSSLPTAPLPSEPGEKSSTLLRRLKGIEDG